MSRMEVMEGPDERKFLHYHNGSTILVRLQSHDVERLKRSIAQPTIVDGDISMSNDDIYEIEHRFSIVFNGEESAIYINTSHMQNIMGVNENNIKMLKQTLRNPFPLRGSTINVL